MGYGSPQEVHLTQLGRPGRKRKFSGDLKDKQKLAKYQGGREGQVRKERGRKDRKA